MTDREMLEWAAKSIGDHAEEYDEKRGVWLANARVWWNPLTDDGDRYRLAMKCHLFSANRDKLQEWTNAYMFTGDGMSFEDAFALSITRAAAEIGRAMK